MADYFESEEVVKGYDGRIVRRILSYLKPYRILAVITFVALAVSTVGELFVPVLIQRLIDGAIVARFVVVRSDILEQEKSLLSAEGLKAAERLSAMENSRSVENRLFIPQSQDLSISGAVEEELRTAGIIEEVQWYAFSYTEGSPLAGLIETRRDIFLYEAGEAAVRRDDLYSLPVDEIRLVRGGDLSLIVSAVTVILAALVLVFVFTFVQTWTTTLIGQRIMKDMRLELFKKTAGQSTAFLSRHPVGRIVTRLTGDVETINEFFTSVLVAFLKDFSIMIGVLITLFLLSPKLALVTLVTIPPVMVATAISRIKARDAFRRQRLASSRVNSYLSEHLSGVQVVQLFSGEQRSRDEFGERNGELLDANLGEMHVFATFRPIIDFLSNLTVAVVIAVGSSFVLNLSLSLGVLIAFINLVQMFYSPIQDIAEKYTILQSAMAGGERVFALMDTDERIPDAGTHHIEGMVRGHIGFDSVHFSYKEGEEVLKGLSFTVNPGEMVAIVGYTGAGKTTITNVLTRLWDIDSGSILLDGVPIKDIPLEELRRSVLPVLQEVFLFSGTVADNIRLGLSLSDAEVEKAARAVHAHEFIASLPEGYETILSEGATNISSGQRQLISFARVIAHNPAIVILDEATSNIDTETEHLIQLGMQRVLAGRTSIVIAHRLSTIRHSDRILVLSGGNLIEQGKHQELIDQNGLYASLYRLQYEKAPDEEA
ncbi:ABC transporter ATP-binding protein [Breznakiella homolactica]|uniref:ABC transporter ATP-binding protein n=1 Tax=Breznakiella homolactica TaxID=2798577 RepID=A0A7T7XLF0_9SPIR|nr:ABC transporter ATP-binding protein [Breznakiella homolactica]QQO08550.1 ABC transporter ATP-binding protein/permease [Breznakiella homolactica]